MVEQGGVSRPEVVSASDNMLGSQVVDYHYQNFHVKLDYGVWPGKSSFRTSLGKQRKNSGLMESIAPAPEVAVPMAVAYVQNTSSGIQSRL